MNHELALGNERIFKGRKVLEVDVNKARHFGKPWKLLDAFGKRKFENLVALQDPRNRPVILFMDNGIVLKKLNA